jgi:bacillithiol biosynthesis cysteine-adding enzyme BshC
MTTVDPSVLYGSHRFFLDYICGVPAASSFFESGPDDLSTLAERRAVGPAQRGAIVDRLIEDQEKLASPSACKRAEALRRPGTFCVVGGQQAGFLGGPAYTAYKILSTIRLARRLSERLATDVVPVFWLASEDHDAGEIESVRFIDESGALETIRIDLPQGGRAVESFATDEAMRTTASRLADRVHDTSARSLFAPQASDDYARWHARIWSQVFANEGLIVVEPRGLRPFAGTFFSRAVAAADAITAALATSAAALETAGYPAPLDPRQVGRLFRFDHEGRRVRIDEATPVDEPRLHPERFSADVALRPVLADLLLPTIANVLGPSEIAYHAMLRPLYSLFNVAQPWAVPRQGYTVLSAEDAEILHRLGIDVAEALAEGFDPEPSLRQRIPRETSAAFDRARDTALEALAPLQSLVGPVDPGLEARWRQARDRVSGEVDGLRARTERALLAREGLSPRRIRGVLSVLRPSGLPQERVLSFIYFASRFGVEWIRRLPEADSPDRFAHQVVVLRGET